MLNELTHFLIRDVIHTTDSLSPFVERGYSCKFFMYLWIPRGKKKNILNI